MIDDLELRWEREIQEIRRLRERSEALHERRMRTAHRWLIGSSVLLCVGLSLWIVTLLRGLL